MLNKLINWFVRLQTARKLRVYKTYPSDKTALLLVNCQQGFLENQEELKVQLTKLTQHAQKRNWTTIHSLYFPSERKFPTPAHQLLDEKIKSKSEDVFLLKSSNNIEIQKRSTLSAFAGTSLENILKKNRIEHIVLAGPMADLTIDSTVRDGVQLDFHTTVILDCISLSSDKQIFDTYKLTLGRYAQTLINFKELKVSSIDK